MEFSKWIPVEPAEFCMPRKKFLLVLWLTSRENKGYNPDILTSIADAKYLPSFANYLDRDIGARCFFERIFLA